MASQMSNAVYDSVTAELQAGDHSFRASASSLKFAGYAAVYEESRDEEKEEKEPALPPLEEGETVQLQKMEPLQHFTQPPAHFTDAFAPWRKTALAAPPPMPPRCPPSWTGSMWSRRASICA